VLYFLAIDRCTSGDPPCHKNAECVFTGPDQFQCSCLPGYVGDGFACSPVDLCQIDAGGCPVESTSCIYLGPGQVGDVVVYKYDTKPMRLCCNFTMSLYV